MNPIDRLATWFDQHLTKRQYLFLLSFLVGVFTAFAAQLLKTLIHEIEHLLTSQFDATQANWLFLVYPVVGILLTALFIKYIVRDNIGHGVTKILYAISRKQGLILRHNTWSSLIASAVTIGFGGSVGAESPIVLTGSAIGSNLGRVFHRDHKTLMLLIGCGASGAVAGIFKAPIAGLVFTLEVLMIDLTMASLLPLLISCLTATCITYAWTGSGAMFDFELAEPFSVERVPTAVLLGVFCGLISLYFTRAMNAFEQVFTRLGGLWSRLLLGGTVLAALIYFFPPLYGEGYNTINILLNSSEAGNAEEVMNNSLFYGNSHLLLGYLGLIIVFKVFATTATNGGGGCGGTFAPSLFLGCIGGFLFSRIWNMYGLAGIAVPETNYALLGMAGVMSGVFHAPLTGVFLIAELTGGYQLFMPLMIVCISSLLTISIFESHSIYALRLAREGKLLTHHVDRSALTLMSMQSMVEKDYHAISPDLPMSKLVSEISRSNNNFLPVLNDAGVLEGVIDITRLRHIIFRTELYNHFKVSQLMIQPSATLSENEPMDEVMAKFDKTDAAQLPVVDVNGILKGYISRTKIYEVYRQIVADMSAE